MPLPAGSITVAVTVPGPLTVNITATSGRSITVYSDSALTSTVTMPHLITATTTYYVATADQYNLSVKRNGVEIAGDVDGGLSGIRLENGNTLRVAPTVDPAKVSSQGEAVSAGVNAQTGTTYEFAVTDAGNIVTFNNGSAITATLKGATNSITWPTGAVIALAQLGAGQVTVAAGSGVTIRTVTGLKLIGQYSAATLYHLGSDVWLLAGGVTA